MTGMETKPEFAALHARHGDALTAYAQAIVGRREWAEEAVQEAFAEMLASPSRFAEARDPKAYLFGAVRFSADILNGVPTIVTAIFRSDSLLVELLDVSICPFLAFIASPKKPSDVARGRISVRSPLVRFAVFIDLVTSEVVVHRLHILGGHIVLRCQLFGTTNPDVRTASSEIVA